MRLLALTIFIAFFTLLTAPSALAQSTYNDNVDAGNYNSVSGGSNSGTVKSTNGGEDLEFKSLGGVTVNYKREANPNGGYRYRRTSGAEFILYFQKNEDGSYTYSADASGSPIGGVLDPV